MKLRSVDLTSVLAAKGATGVEYNNGFYVEDFRNLVIQLSVSTSASLTIKFLGSVSDTAPDFSAAASEANHYDTLNFIYHGRFNDQEGDDGLVFAGDDVDQFRDIVINTNGIKFFNIKVTAHTLGNVTAKVKPFTND